MCTILDAAEQRGIIQEIIMLVQKKVRKNKKLAQIADEVEEDEIKIQPIYEVIIQNPEATAEEIYQIIDK